ncbi:MAG: hypothetical protein HY356_04550, partial [Gammaproteobacteria bacterium]|nr:hypothetical protein [Gammaproteobacteria bacterium]
MIDQLQVPEISEEPIPAVDQLDAAAANYVKEVVDLLNEQLCSVIAARKPAILPVFTGQSPIPDDKDILLNILQAWGIWF